MDTTTECLRAVTLADQSAGWDLDTLTTFDVSNRYMREYVVGAYMHHHPRADVAKVAEACGLKWSLASGKPRCKSLENYRKFFTNVGEIAAGFDIPTADALAMLARDRADERTKARKATASRVQEMLSQQTPETEPEPEPGESAFPEPELAQTPEAVDIITGDEIEVPAPVPTVRLPADLVKEIMEALTAADRTDLVDRMRKVAVPAPAF